MTPTMPMPSPQELVNTAPSELMQLVTGYWVSQSIYVIAKLGIPDLLADGPLPIEQISRSVGANEDFLYRIMRALASVDVLDECAPKAFQLTPISDLLRTDHPQSMRAISIMTGEEHYVAWGHLKHSVLSGNLPFESVFGMKVFEYFEQNPEAAETFNTAMTAVAANEHGSIVPAYDFSRFDTIVDVGGGTGGLLFKLLHHHPDLKAILFDLPHVIDDVPPLLEDSNLEIRCRLVGGDFFEGVPSGSDAYLLSHVLHDWNDKNAFRILKNVHQAMPDNGTLLLAECVLDGDNTSPRAKFMDLNMLVMTPGGRERTKAEFEQLLNLAGFRLSRVIVTQSVVSILEAFKTPQE